MNGMEGLVALVVALIAACLFLMWRYTDWNVRMRAVATALVCVVAAIVVIPAVTRPGGEFAIVRVSELDALVQGASQTLADAALPPPTPAPETGETPQLPEEAQLPEETVPPPEGQPPESQPLSESPPPETESAPPAPAQPPESPAREAPSYYILNTSTKKFHLPTCSDAGRIKDENRATTATRQGAVDGGYAACKRCNP